MAQSVELLLDEEADATIRRQWSALAAAGLPSAQRNRPDQHHRPHITVYAADQIPAEAEPRLPGLVDRLRLDLEIGAVMIFGPRRGRCIVVRLVPPTLALLSLQQQIAALCGADPHG